MTLSANERFGQFDSEFQGAVANQSPGAKPGR